jgi:hypothetical protein
LKHGYHHSAAALVMTDSRRDEPSSSPSGLVKIPEGLGKPPEEAAQMLMAVGFVAWASASVDEVLRELFCGLEGSKYAAVTAGGQGSSWLMEACKALAKWRDDVSAEHKEQLSQLFGLIKTRMGERNSYVHSIWQFHEPGATAYFPRSQHGCYFESPRLATPEDVVDSARALLQARKAVSAWMDKAGITGADLAGQMKWEAFWNQPSNEEGD